MGQSRRFALALTTSGLTSTADITHRDDHFRKVPTADVVIVIRVFRRHGMSKRMENNIKRFCRLEIGDKCGGLRNGQIGRLRREAPLYEGVTPAA